jgi:hypothetical protein
MPVCVVRRRLLACLFLGGLILAGMPRARADEQPAIPARSKAEVL